LKIAFNFKLILTPSSRQKIKSQIQISKNTLNLNFNLEKIPTFQITLARQQTVKKTSNFLPPQTQGKKNNITTNPKKTSVSKTKDRQEKVLHLSSAVERKTEKK
jgi:hypothetical protein